jgi:hypothetical protein
MINPATHQGVRGMSANRMRVLRPPGLVVTLDPLRHSARFFRPRVPPPFVPSVGPIHATCKAGVQSFRPALRPRESVMRTLGPRLGALDPASDCCRPRRNSGRGVPGLDLGCAQALTLGSARQRRCVLPRSLGLRRGPTGSPFRCRGVPEELPPCTAAGTAASLTATTT